MKRLMRHTFLLLAACLLAACSDEVEDTYANHRALFVFSPTTAAPELHAALNNPGMFCAITFDSKYFTFTNSEGRSTPVPRSGYAQYGTPECIAGFVAGQPSIPNLNGNFYLIAFDFACPDCYDNGYIRRNLTFIAPETMECSRCHTRYALNNQGFPLNGGEQSKPLYRYHISYAPETGLLRIQN